MFGKFINQPLCMRVLNWFLEHPDDEYSASIIGMECESPDVTTFIAVVSILEGVHLVSINEGSEELLLSFNKDESIAQLLSHFKDEFNDLAFKTEAVSPALSYLYSEPFKNLIDSEVISQVIRDKNLDLLEKCENYETLDLDEPIDAEIYKICKQLDAENNYEGFLEFLREQR